MHNNINKITIGIYPTFPAGLKKKLTALSNQKDCSELGPWIKAIGNHMYWTAASTPQQDGELMLAKWQSLLNHIVNVHTGHSERFQQCLHPIIPPSDDRKKWLTPGNILVPMK